MATNKKSFIAYCDWLETFEELDDAEAGRLVKHLFRYVNDLDPQAEDKLTKMTFIPIKQTLKRDLKKHEAVIERNRENGAKGGRPKKPTGLSGLNEKPKKADSDSVSDSDNVNESVSVNVKEKEKKKGVPPSFDEFLNYARDKATERSIYLDETKVKAKFYSWLENDWSDLNGTKILNWKSKITSNVNYWQGEKPTPKTNPAYPPFEKPAM